MNDDIYRPISLNYVKDNDFYFSNKNYNNEDFNLQKYQKFKPKDNESYFRIKSIKGAEDKVKHLLSIFLKNYEKEEKSDIFEEIEKTRKSFDINLNESNNDYKRFKKDKSSLKRNSLNVNLNSSFNVSQRKKVRFLDISSFNSKTNSMTKGNKLKRNKTSKKYEKKERNNKKWSRNKTTKNILYINSNSLIKKQKMSKDSYLNFKNDRIIINKSQNNNEIKLKTVIKNKMDNLKKRNKNKKIIFNDSEPNSLLSDFSDNNIIRKSFDKNTNYNNDELTKKDNIKNNIPNKYKQFLNVSQRGSSTLASPKKDKNNSLSQKKITNINRISAINKDTKNIKRSTSVDEEKKDNTNIFKFDKQFKLLKKMLKKSLILHPEDLSMNKEEKMKNKTIINNKNKNTYNYHLKNLQKSIILTNDISHKSMTNIIRNDSKTDLKEKVNNSLLKKSKINNIDDSNKLQDKKTYENINNLENKNLIKFIGSSKNSLEDYTTYIKGKGESYIGKYRVLTHKPIVYDSLDDEEFEDEEEIKTLYLDPNSSFTIIFDLILFTFNIISLFQSPLYLAMNHKFCKKKHITLNFTFNLLVELVNILDLFFGFFRAYYNWEEQLIQKKRIISRKYVTGWFIFDLLSSIPVYTINKICEPQCQENKISLKYYNTVLDNLHYLLISNRILKAFKIFLYNQAWKNISNKLNDYGRITLYFILFLATINYTACIHIFLGRNSYPNWIFITNLDTEPFYHIYICSIYVITMAVTTVGYGDITCYSFSERIFQLFLLIIGIFAYSFLVSFLSNYIQKLNEKSVDFDNKKSILDEIKRNNPNMPHFLYDRIIKFLRHKIIYEKKFKNSIFDCLPLGLKNNLIAAMYKPIIDNFIFFKYFQNTDFNVRVILAFKPIIAYKNDILVNEGDMIEEIMFVKKGILSVELPINIFNHKENIKKYLNRSSLAIEKGPNIQKIGNTTIIKQSLNKAPSFLNISTSMKYNATFNKKLSFFEKQRKEKEEKELERKKNLTYVKIIGIRENEHFGDVLMFLEQRSPLRVRVRSKKCELFFLKKIDAVSISANYPNIWENINKKSIFNYEQLKKSIKNIVEIYCSVKTIQSNDKNIDIDKINRKPNHKMIYKNNSDSNKLSFKEKKEALRSKSINIPKINYSVFFKNNNDLLIKKNNKKNYSLSVRHLKSKIMSSLNSSIHSSSGLNIKRKNKNNNPKSYEKISDIKNQRKEKKEQFGKKVLDAFNGKYKYYKRVNINNNDALQNSNIIIEETEQDISEDTFKNNYRKKRLSTKNKHLTSEMLNELLSIKNNKNSYNSIDNNEEEDIFYDKGINDELFSGEVINVNNEDNLLNRKIIFNNKSDFNNNNINFKNDKIKLLLDSSEDENENNKQKEKKQNNKKKVNIFKKSNETNNSSLNEIKQTQEQFDNNDSNNDNNNNCDLSKNSAVTIYKNKKVNWDNNFLSINNNISFRVDSSYSNFNLISGNRLIKNKLLQNKLKIYLLDEIQNLYQNKNYNSTTNSIILENIKKQNSLADSIQYSDINDRFINSIKPKKKSISLSKINKINKCATNKKYSLYHGFIVSDTFTKALNHSSSNTNNNQRSKIDKIKENMIPSLIENDDDTLSNKRRDKERINQNDRINKDSNKYNIINNNINYINNSIIDIQKKTKRNRNSEMIKPLIKNKKKKNNILSKINNNIQKTNQNLNNPDEFYNNYFNAILGKENKENKKRNTFFFGQQNNELFKLQKDNLGNIKGISKFN